MVNRAQLLAWYDSVRRDLPWRRNADPYSVWVSEIMLQQTRVLAVIPFFERWMARFPTVESLASAPEDEVLTHWQGLGYYRRCRSLQAGAQFVVANGFPANPEGWRQVPGIGAYTAGAICSIAYGQATPLVDGNVIRVYSRLTADRETSPRIDKNAWIWAAANVDQERPGDWNQALMELGATVCKPKQPTCDLCPLKDECLAYAHDLTQTLPVTVPKAEPIQLVRLTLIPRHNDLFGVERIPSGEWWEGMWRFPNHSGSSNSIAESNSDTRYVGCLTHTVTKHRIRLEVFARDYPTPDPTLKWLNRDELESIAMPTPQRKALALLAKSSPGLFD